MASPGFEPVVRRSLPDSVAEQLTRRLRAGEFAVGQQLPGHRQLAAAFGVSMTVVREALSRLVAEGWLEIRAGQGTFVRARRDEDATGGAFEITASTEAELLEILEVRTVLEVALGGLAAERADDGRVATLQRLVDRMRAHHDDPDGFLEADLAFHLALSEAADNTVLLRVMLGLRASMRRFLEARTGHRVSAEHRTSTSVDQRQAIVDAIVHRDPDAARRAVSALMERTLHELQDGAGR